MTEKITVSWELVQEVLHHYLSDEFAEHLAMEILHRDTEEDKEEAKS